MIIMSVDLGKARTGLAVSDPSGQFAFPKEVITEYNTEKLIEKICALVVTELKKQGLTDSDADFLEAHTYHIMGRIKDEQLSRCHVTEG